MNQKTAWVFIGFLLFVTGTLSLVLSLVGVEFVMNLSELLGKLTAFLLKVGLTVSGIVIVALARTDWEQKDDEFIKE